jgi:SAM-dependent methyltransferase
MVVKKIRVPARAGYDRWAPSYDATPNPVVALDERHTLALLAPRDGERILDAGCGTGRHFERLQASGAHAVGADFSAGMLAVLRRRMPRARLVLAGIEAGLPLAGASFDAVLCALVGEHLGALGLAFSEMARVLRPGGRIVFSVYHPRMAEAGSEANFEDEGVEYRLGAERHGIDDYIAAMRAAGLEAGEPREWAGDEALALAIPKARRYVGFPLLLVLVGRKPPAPA